MAKAHHLKTAEDGFQIVGVWKAFLGRIVTRDNDLEWSDPFDSSSLDLPWERIPISPHLKPIGKVFHVLRVRFPQLRPCLVL